MPRTYKPKREIFALTFNKSKLSGAYVENWLLPWRLYIFSRAEELYPSRFEELKTIARCTNPEESVAKWVRSLNLVRYPRSKPAEFCIPRAEAIQQYARQCGIRAVKVCQPPATPISMPKCDLWLRALAMERAQALQENEAPTRNLIVGGILWDKPFRRVRKQKRIPAFGPKREFRQHIDWFLRKRIEHLTCEQLAEREGVDPSTVKRAVKAVEKLIDPPERT